MPFRSKEQSCKGHKAAVLIGINYSGTDAALQGCENDVGRLNEHLTTRYGFEDITVLTEQSSILPTKENILRSLRQLADKTHSGVDHAFIHYSGHGTSVPDDNGEEDDGMDEAWFTLDQKILRDDDIRSILNTFSPWCDVVIVVDACHSGTGVDLPLKYVGNAGFVEIENNTAPLCNAIMLSGCRDTQTSADAFVDGKFGGAMTDAFLKCHVRSRNIFDLMHNMHDYMRARGHTQRPQLSSSRPLKPDDHLSQWLR